MAGQGAGCALDQVGLGRDVLGVDGGARCEMTDRIGHVRDCGVPLEAAVAMLIDEVGVGGAAAKHVLDELAAGPAAVEDGVLGHWEAGRGGVFLPLGGAPCPPRWRRS